MQNKISYINSSFDEQIAYSKDDLKSQTTIFFFGGYSSSMDGTKATALSKWCIENKLNFLRFDYSGHGVSKGRFCLLYTSPSPRDATLSRMPSSA